ncbi:flagellar biosynthesis protein FlgL [Chelatococcus sp. SYSU_G07232]|uniref:Flagellar biosynthesis protein FlgL n=1 Tax=Chelatococcus albus TaxID=3047466 RepID=A0ABT7AGK9_9HYPH|nr:flagellar biosynthesis protein FlgL [Chelatococcus sp. SYSU_G07232]MDJ1158468.1 flagellar biosynthesis protein FlgL [Chelatococcus sp. SYSU_G07232]
MAINSFKPGSVSAQRSSSLFVNMRAELNTLMQQISTGKLSDTYGGLGFDRRTSLDFRAQLSTIAGYKTSIQDGDLRLKLMNQSLERIAKITREAKTDVPPGNFTPAPDGRTLGQKQAEERLREAIDLLNTGANGRYLFSGKAADVKPVESFDLMMNGDGARAGLKALMDERKRADRGALDGSGRYLGRLALSRAGTTVNLGETVAGLPFGFKISGATSSNTTAMPVTGPGGSPTTVSFDVAAQPKDGDKVSVLLTLPDGTQETIELVARMTPNPSSTEKAFIIGATPADTATNLEAALGSAVDQKARTALAASSSIVASKNFFAGTLDNPPKRIAGAPESAVTTVPGTTADTVVWYKGTSQPSGGGVDSLAARASSVLRIDSSQVAAIGAQANEDGIAHALAHFAVLAAETFPASETTAAARYDAVAERIRTNLDYPGGTQRVEDIIVELANAGTAMKAATERHKTTEGFLNSVVDGVENISQEQVAASILALQTRLQATYQTTAILSKLTLTNYL